MVLKKHDLQLIAITDRASLQYDISLHDAVEEALKGGATMVILYERNLGHDALMREAVRLKILCGMYDIPFAVSGSVDIAEAVDADGVLLDKDDAEVKDAQQILGRDRFVGAMARSAEDAVEAEKDGASFIMCGPVKVTDIKSSDVSISVEELKDVSAAVNVPVVAYGGIADLDMNELGGTGICGIGAMTGIFGQNDIEQAAASLRKISDDIL